MSRAVSQLFLANDISSTPSSSNITMSKARAFRNDALVGAASTTAYKYKLRTSTSVAQHIAHLITRRSANELSPVYGAIPECVPTAVRMKDHLSFETLFYLSCGTSGEWFGLFLSVGMSTSPCHGVLRFPHEHQVHDSSDHHQDKQVTLRCHL